MGCLPLFHVFGLTCSLNAGVLAGARRSRSSRGSTAARRCRSSERDGVTVFQGVPTMFSAMLHQPDAGRPRHVAACGCASPAARPCRWRSCARSRRRSAASCSRATGCPRPRRSPRSTTRTPSASPARSARPIRGVEMRLVDDDGNDVAGRRGRRDRHPRRERHEGLLAAPGGHREGHPRRLVPHRRPRPPGRGRLLLHRRPQEGDDHPRRLQRVPAGDRGGAVRAPGGGRGRRASASSTPTSARRSPRRSRSSPGQRRPRRAARRSSRSGWPPTSTRGTCGWSTSLPKGPTGKILRRSVEVPEEVGQPMSTPPAVAAGFDAAERAVTPRAESLRPDAGLRRSAPRSSAAPRRWRRATARDLTARAWHLVNLPGGQRRQPAAGPDRRPGPRGAAAEPAAGGRTPAHRPHPPPASRRHDGGAAMPTVPSPQAVLDRVRRDVERNALRARNGIKLVAGVDRPGVGQTPEGRRLAARPRRALALPQRRTCGYAPAAAHRVQPDQPQLHPRPDAGQQLRRAAARRRLRRLPARLGRARRAGRRQRGSRTTSTTTSRPAIERVLRASRAPTRSTCSATASAATSRCSTPPTIPTRRCAASR